MKKIGELLLILWKRLKHNLGLKLLSLLFAFLLWNSVIATTNPTIERQAENIKITVIGKEEMNNNGLALLEDISEYLTKVKVYVKLYRSDLQYFNENNIQVSLDLSRIYDTGPQQVKLTAYTNQGSIEKIVPDSITLDVEKRKSKIIPVECKTISQVPEGYYAGKLTVSPNSIQINGPESVVGQIVQAQLSLDLSDIKSSISTSRSFTLVDSEGNAVDDSAIDMSVDSALLAMEVNPKKMLRIDPKSAVTGQDKLPEGYTVTNIELFPPSVEVTGDAELLDNLDTLSTEVVDIAGLSDDIETEIGIFKPDGITLLSAEKVVVLVRIDEIMQEKTFDNVKVQYKNLPDGLKVENFDMSTSITVKAPVNKISTISASHLTLYIDLNGLAAGDHDLPVLIDTLPEYGIVSTVIADPTATITLIG